MKQVYISDLKFPGETIPLDQKALAKTPYLG